ASGRPIGPEASLALVHRTADRGLMVGPAFSSKYSRTQGQAPRARHLSLPGMPNSAAVPRLPPFIMRHAILSDLRMRPTDEAFDLKSANRSPDDLDLALGVCFAARLSELLLGAIRTACPQLGSIP